MAISTIRKYTPEDNSRLNMAARRFTARYGLADYLSCGEWEEVDSVVSYGHQDLRHPAYGRLYQWKRAMCRALREPYSRDITVGYGYVGHYAQ